MPNSNRAAPRVPVNPLPKAATIKVTPMALNSSTPPTRLQISINAVSRFGNDRQSGHTRAPRYDSNPLHTPAKMQVSTTASRTLRLGFSTSSASVVTPSNPM